MSFVTVLDDCSLTEAFRFLTEILALPSAAAPAPRCPNCAGPLVLIRPELAHFSVRGFRPDGTLTIADEPSILEPDDAPYFACAVCRTPVELLDHCIFVS